MFLLRTLRASTRLCCNNQSVVRNFIKNSPQAGYVLRQIGVHCRHSSTGTNPTLDQHEIIYNGSLTTRMKVVKVFSLSTSFMGIAAQPIVYEQATNLGGTSVIILMCGFVGFFTFVTPLLLHFITKKYVTEITYNMQADEYTATTISFFLTNIETKFKTSDVKVPDVPGMFTSFIVGKTPLFIDPTMFTDTEHYVKIMGYDKPIDFKLTPAKDKTSGKQELER